MVLLHVITPPVTPQARVDFYVTTRGLSYDPGHNADGFIGFAHSSSPGPIEVIGGIPWSTPRPPGDTFSVWVAVNWLENAVSIDRDSTIALVRLGPDDAPPLYDTVSITLSR
jgi:hypothetical protein